MSPDYIERPRRWYHELSILRWIFAIFGILVMAFSGGCSLYILFGAGGFEDPLVVALVGGVPFLFGLLVWSLAVKFK